MTVLTVIFHYPSRSFSAADDNCCLNSDGSS